ncbi:hypothetical protein B0H17DRAFT_1210152 [Mycena rosella]|uniref:Uncharacterized protein n=1 Tax=Mycena rosella TaxID=1033263 RepID=A0AAD7CWY0_MYCRO|nr:hypothetical protein B0H17DRAFT_1210152 [Mycena rosella]
MSAHNETPNVTAADTAADTSPLPAATFTEAVDDSPAASPAKKVTRTDGAEDTSWVLPPNRFNAPWKSPGAQRKTSGAGKGKGRDTGPSGIDTAALASATGTSPQARYVLNILRTPPTHSKRPRRRGRGQSQSPTPAQRVKEIETGHHESDLEDGEIPVGNPSQHETDDESDDLADYIKFPPLVTTGSSKPSIYQAAGTAPAPSTAPAAPSPTPDPDGSRAVAAAEFNARMADTPAQAALPFQAAPLTRETVIHVATTNGDNAASTDSGLTAAAGGQPSEHHTAMSVDDDEAADGDAPEDDAMPDTDTVFNQVTPTGHDFVFDNDVQAAEHEAQTARDAAAAATTTAAKAEQTARDARLARQLYQQQLDADDAKREHLRGQQRQQQQLRGQLQQQQRQREPDQQAMDIADGADIIDTGDVVYPDFAEAAKLPATGRDENPHRAFIPGDVITAEAAAFEVNVTQPIPPETFYRMVASDATIYNGVNPGTVTAIKADMPGHLIASVFLGGKTLNERIGPEGWCKVLRPPAAPTPTVPTNLPPAPKGPTTYQGPTILVIQVRDAPTRTKVSARELYIKSDVAAFSIIAPETTQNSWVAGFLECSDDGDSPTAAEQLRLQAIIYMVTDATFAVTVQRTLPPGVSLKATLLALALSADPVWNARMGAFVLYVKPSTTNTVHWQGIADLVGGQTFRSVYYEYKPHGRKRLLNENRCVLCKHDTHFVVACPCPHTLLYWGPKHQVKDTTDGLLARGRGGGRGGRGAPGGRGGHRGRGGRGRG